MKPDEHLIKSYVFHKDRCFYVSTIDRDSSAMLGPERYAETLVWDYDWEKRTTLSLMYQRDCVRKSIHQHLKVCEELYSTGELRDDSD